MKTAIIAMSLVGVVSYLMKTAIIILVLVGIVSYLMSKRPKCPDCNLRAEYNDGWSRWYCPKCHKRV